MLRIPHSVRDSEVYGEKRDGLIFSKVNQREAKKTYQDLKNDLEQISQDYGVKLDFPELSEGYGEGKVSTEALKKEKKLGLEEDSFDEKPLATTTSIEGTLGGFEGELCYLPSYKQSSMINGIIMNAIEASSDWEQDISYLVFYMEENGNPDEELADDLQTIADEHL